MATAIEILVKLLSLGEKRFIDKTPQTPEDTIDPEVILDTICLFEQYIQSTKYTEKPMISVRISKDSMAGIFHRNGYRFKAVMAGVSKDGRRVVCYTSDNKWKIYFCGQEVIQEDFNRYMETAASLATQTANEFLISRDIDYRA